MTAGHHDAYERALGDEEFRYAVRDHYRGSRDVLDALWWRAHPDQASPQGEPAPSGRVRALQRRVFAADADAAGDDAVHRALRELEAESAAEREAIDDAVLAAGQQLEGAGAARVVLVRPMSPQDDELQHDAGLAVSADGLPAAPEKPAGASRNRLRLTAGLIVAAVLGGVAGAQIVGMVAADRTEGPAAASANAKAFEIFDTHQTVADVPVIPLPDSFQPLTLRSLGSITWESVDPPAESQFYVVRAELHRVCLILLIDDPHYLSSCVGESEFTASGLTLYWTGDQALASDALAPSAGHRNWFVTWKPDGAMSVGPAAAEGDF
ncbi:hypothetical protein [Cryobacterium arcticum]|uniref:Uncharacterized protein n=1 Tax=Cryobacterium arcticum TaxID=670052 RepID=A0A1B1BNB3_9MICO|nr:hypothetical protein [Cryobacterium arcticum]ANP73986.1 hypothetical protein PA27867_3050 [Cryobacterium arcticum]